MESNRSDSWWPFPLADGGQHKKSHSTAKTQETLGDRTILTKTETREFCETLIFALISRSREKSTDAERKIDRNIGRYCDRRRDRDKSQIATETGRSMRRATDRVCPIWNKMDRSRDIERDWEIKKMSVLSDVKKSLPPARVPTAHLQQAVYKWDHDRARKIKIYLVWKNRMSLDLRLPWKTMESHKNDFRNPDWIAGQGSVLEPATQPPIYTGDDWQGCFRLGGLFSLRRLGPRMDHLPPAWWSTFWLTFWGEGCCVSLEWDYCHLMPRFMVSCTKLFTSLFICQVLCTFIYRGRGLCWFFVRYWLCWMTV